MNKHVNSPRKAVNLSVSAKLLSEAKDLDVSLSRAAEAGIADAVQAEKERRWREENSEKVQEWNKWVEENGLPLAEYRLF